MALSTSVSRFNQQQLRIVTNTSKPNSEEVLTKYSLTLSLQSCKVPCLYLCLQGQPLATPSELACEGDSQQDPGTGSRRDRLWHLTVPSCAKTSKGFHPSSPGGRQRAAHLFGSLGFTPPLPPTFLVALAESFCLLHKNYPMPGQMRGSFRR